MTSARVSPAFSFLVWPSFSSTRSSPSRMRARQGTGWVCHPVSVPGGRVTIAPETLAVPDGY